MLPEIEVGLGTCQVEVTLMVEILSHTDRVERCGIELPIYYLPYLSLLAH